MAPEADSQDSNDSSQGSVRKRVKLTAQATLIAAAGGEEALKKKLLSGSFVIDASWLLDVLMKFYDEALHVAVDTAIKAAKPKDIAHEATRTLQQATAQVEHHAGHAEENLGYFKVKETLPVIQLKFAKADSEARLETIGTWSMKDFGVGGETKAGVFEIPVGDVTNAILGAFLPLKLSLGIKFQSSLLQAWQAWMSSKSSTQQHGEPLSVCDIGFSSAISFADGKGQLSAEMNALSLNYEHGKWGFREPPAEMEISLQASDAGVFRMRVSDMDVDAKLSFGIKFVVEPNWPKILETVDGWVETYLGAAIDLGAIEALTLLASLSIIMYGAWLYEEQQNVSNSIDDWATDDALMQTANILINGVTAGLVDDSTSKSGGTAFSVGHQIGVGQRDKVGFDPKLAQHDGDLHYPDFDAWQKMVRSVFTTTDATEQGCKLVRYLTFDRWFQYSRDRFTTPTEDQVFQAWKTITDDPRGTRLSDGEAAFYTKSTGYKPLR